MLPLSIVIFLGFLEIKAFDKVKKGLSFCFMDEKCFLRTNLWKLTCITSSASFAHNLQCSFWMCNFPLTPRARRSVGWPVDQFIIISLKGENFLTPIGALIFSMRQFDQLSLQIKTGVLKRVGKEKLSYRNNSGQIKKKR